jgi:multidrug efflux pump subunit AcrA (membrane-fusion protein)
MSASSTTLDAQTRDSSRAVDEVLDELDSLAAAELSDEDFYKALLPKLVQLGCPAAAVWTIDSEGGAKLAWKSASESNGHEPQLNSVEYEPAVLAACHAGQPKVVEPSPTATESILAGRSVIAPWSAAISTRGAVQTWLPERTNTAAISGYLRVLSVVAEVVGTFLDRQQQRRTRRQFELLTRLDTFVRGLYENLDLNQVAYKIANDGRILLGCDRLAVVLRRRGKFQAIAVSGADHVHRRSESIRQLQTLATTVARSGEPLWHTGRDASASDLLPQIRDALEKYLDESPSVACAVLPLQPTTAPQQKSAPPTAVLVLEQYSAPFDPSVRELTPLVGEHARLALNSAQQFASIPGHRLWLKLRKVGWLSRFFSRAFLATLALAAIAAALVLIPADVRIQAPGELQPVVRHEVFAPRDGVVTAIHVDHGQTVEKGQPLLELRSPELDLEIQRVAGELETARKRLAAAQSERLQTRPSDSDARLRQRRLTAEEEQLGQQVRDLTERQKMLDEQRQELVVRSPIQGDVVTWNVEQQLASRPLRRGDALVTVADVSGDWQLELKVPSRRAGRLLAARRRDTDSQPVSFVLATSPGASREGKLSDVSPRLEIDETGQSYIKATVAFDKAQVESRAPGASALAKIDCGRGTLAEAWFHDLIDTVLLWLPF